MIGGIPVAGGLFYGGKRNKRAGVYPDNKKQQPFDQERADFGGKHWWLLGFLLPPIGFLLFAFLRCSRPKTAKDLLHGACFGLLFYAFCYGCFFLSHLKTSTGYRYWQ